MKAIDLPQSPAGSIAAGAGVLVVGAVAWWLWPAEGEVPQAGENRYAGSAECRRCHPEAFAAWSDSAHAKNMAPPSPESVVGDFTDKNEHDFGGTRSRMYREGDGWFMEHTDRAGHKSTHEVAYVVGIARHQAYLTRQEDGRLQILPTYWNVEEEAWRDSVQGPVPGDAPLSPLHMAFWSNYARTFNLVCMECHASQPDKRYDPKTDTYDSNFDPSVNCESCHGKGGAHVDRWDALRRDEPQHLAPLHRYDLDESIEVCAACHAAKRVYATGFDPGESLYDFFAPDVWSHGRHFVDGRSSSLNYRYVDYMQNGCFRRTTRQMDCGFCHSPHQLSSVKDATVTQSNRICTQCHLGHKTRLTEHTHHAPESEGSRCIECHMPEMDLDLRMTVRDHSIGSPLPELSRRYGVPNACGNCHEKEGNAWLEEAMGRWYGDRPSYQDYRKRMLDRAAVLSAVEAQPKRPPVARLVAWLDDRQRSVIERGSAAAFLVEAKHDDAAFQALLRHLEDPHPLIRFYVVEALAGHMPRAIPALRKALADDRLIVRVRAYEAVHLRDPTVDTDPAFAAVRAEHHYRQTVILADDPRHLSDQALWHFGNKRLGEAEGLLRRAVSISEPVTTERAKLVRLLLQTGKHAEAQKEVEKLERDDAQGTDTRMSKALLLLHQGRGREALPLIDALLATARGERATLMQMRRTAASQPPR